MELNGVVERIVYAIAVSILGLWLILGNDKLITAATEIATVPVWMILPPSLLSGYLVYIGLMNRA